MYELPRPVTFLGKAEYLAHPVSRRLFPAAGMIPVDRSGRGVAASLRAAAQRLDQGDIVGIFPEGTRSRDGLLHQGHVGAAHLALHTGAPIVPVGIIGTDRVQPPGRRLPRVRGHVQVRFGAPIDLGRWAGRGRSAAVKREITEELMTAIAALSGQSPRRRDRAASIARTVMAVVTSSSGSGSGDDTGNPPPVVSPAHGGRSCPDSGRAPPCDELTRNDADGPTPYPPWGGAVGVNSPCDAAVVPSTAAAVDRIQSRRSVRSTTSVSHALADRVLGRPSCGRAARWSPWPTSSRPWVGFGRPAWPMCLVEHRRRAVRRIVRRSAATRLDRWPAPRRSPTPATAGQFGFGACPLADPKQMPSHHVLDVDVARSQIEGGLLSERGRLSSTAASTNSAKRAEGCDDRSHRQARGQRDGVEVDRRPEGSDGVSQRVRARVRVHRGVDRRRRPRARPSESASAKSSRWSATATSGVPAGWVATGSRHSAVSVNSSVTSSSAGR